MNDTRIRRALISVHDKQGVTDLARTLVGLGVEILSSGGTARQLVEAGLPVTAVSDYTGFPEMLDGRVKTLHPRIHAGILAVRSNPRHRQDLAQAEIEPIDLVVVNLYPFERTTTIEGIGLGDVVEMIDIGGPAMVRAAAKNFAHVAVVVDPQDYAGLIAELNVGGSVSAARRQQLAVKAFRHTAAYDSAISSYLDRIDRPEEDRTWPERLSLDFLKVQDLRYGENPHQRAAFYREPASTGPSLARGEQLQGKEMSFNNILDADAALAVVLDLPAGGCAIIKHGNPCGVGLGENPVVAFQRALQCDPLSAFGGVIALNRPADRRVAEAIAEQFYEVVIAPSFDREARAVLSSKKALRLIELRDDWSRPVSGHDLRRVAGGLLVQDPDRLEERVREARVATSRHPTADEWPSLELAWIVARHVKSNAIVFARADRTIGIGAGQMSRVDASRLAAQKAQSPLAGCAMASDAFFPFRDGLDVAAECGVSAVVQPGGSVRDDEVIAAADEHGMTMVLTGRRHFRH